MAYQSNAPSQKPYEQKPRTGSMFFNEEFNPQGDPEDTNNFWGNGKLMETDGTVLNFRVYSKVAKSGKVWYKLSMYPPKDQQQGQQSQQYSQPVQQAPVQQPPVQQPPVQQPPVQQQGQGEKMPWDD